MWFILMLEVLYDCHSGPADHENNHPLSKAALTWQGALAVKNVELAAASQEAEKLLKEISESTAVAEKEKMKVAVIVDQVSATAAVRWATHLFMTITAY